MTSITTNFPGKEAWNVLRQDQQLLELATTISVDAAGALLDERANPGTDSASAGGLWDRLKAEFFSLVCEDSEVYKDLRDRAAQAGHALQTIGIPTLAATLAANLHLEAALVLPFVALLAAACATVGTRAWCSEQQAVRLATSAKLQAPPAEQS